MPIDNALTFSIAKTKRLLSPNSGHCAVVATSIAWGMDRVRLASAIIVTTAYWMLVAFIVFAQFACIQGDPEYGCAANAQRTRIIIGIIVGAAAAYALGYRWLRRRNQQARRSSVSDS